MGEEVRVVLDERRGRSVMGEEERVVLDERSGRGFDGEVLYRRLSSSGRIRSKHNFSSLYPRKVVSKAYEG